MEKLVHFLVIAMIWIPAEFTKIEVPASTLQLFETLHIHCEQQSKVKDVDKYIKQFNSQTNIDNKQFQCYIKCMLVETSVFDEQTDVLDLTPMEALYSKSFIDSIREPAFKCFDKFKNIPEICERAYKSFKCLNEADPENVIVY